MIVENKRLERFLLFAVVFALFVLSVYNTTEAFEYKVVQTVLTNFYDGSKTVDISFPPGGGTNSDAKIKLPKGTQIFSAQVDMVAKGGEIGTPYIWVPKTGSNQLVQIRTKDCSIVKTFSNGSDNCASDAFSSPSRITVIPGGDVWVDNRTNARVTRLGLVDSSISMEKYECKGSYNIAGGGGTNGGGITFDADGNIWIGNYSDTFVHKLKPDGSYAWPSPYKINANGHATYGMIGDSRGHVWIANRGIGGETIQCIETDKNNGETSVNVITAYTYSSGSVYGIGMDKNGGIYTANYDSGEVYQFSPLATDSCPTIPMIPVQTLSTGGGHARGVAVDQKGNVWVANSGDNRLYVFDAEDNYKKHSASLPGSGIVGVAIDSSGYGWAVGYNDGKVYKYEYKNGILSEECTVAVGSNPYNYSDMTGLRTILKKLIIGGKEFIINGVTFSGWGDKLEAELANCTTVDGKNCEIPLEITSEAGDFTLQNLKVVYGELIPISTGGIVPCGRNDDNPDTPWKEDVPCNACHLILMIQLIVDFLLKLVGVVALFVIVVSGLVYMLSVGNSSRMESAKTAVKYSLVGFSVIFVAWAVVSTILILFGYSDPLGGEWYTLNCDVPFP